MVLRSPVTAESRRPRQGSFAALIGGTFLMGTDDEEGFPDDAEGPVREVEIAPFRMARTTVTNRQFAAFVRDSGYVTDAEQIGWAFVFHLLLHPEARRYVLDGTVREAPWWLGVHGASWRSPDGPGSDLEGREEHPAVQVSWRDALAYCDWSFTRLPSEAEWEYAARGGLVQRRYPWGDELTPRGQHRCNIWQGKFPTHNSKEDGWLGTAPAKSFRPNGFGLFNMAGNVWEWCLDPWSPDGSDDVQRVMRGGSYLCHASYCNRYRVAARSRNTVDTSSGNTGFRVAADVR